MSFDRIWTIFDLDKLSHISKVFELEGVLNLKSLLTIGALSIARFWHEICIISPKIFTKFS